LDVDGGAVGLVDLIGTAAPCVAGYAAEASVVVVGGFAVAEGLELLGALLVAWQW